MMTCSTLAAIMSTADSAVMGASSIVSAAWSSVSHLGHPQKSWVYDPMKSGCCFHPPYGCSICRALRTQMHSLFSEPRFYLDVGESGYIICVISVNGHTNGQSKPLDLISCS
jgi:hypothetical protein